MGLLKRGDLRICKFGQPYWWLMRDQNKLVVRSSCNDVGVDSISSVVGCWVSHKVAVSSHKQSNHHVHPEITPACYSSFATQVDFNVGISTVITSWIYLGKYHGLDHDICAFWSVSLSRITTEVAAIVAEKSKNTQSCNSQTGLKSVTLLSTFLVNSLTHAQSTNPPPTSPNHKTTMTSTPPKTKPPNNQMAESTQKRGGNKPS